VLLLLLLLLLMKAIEPGKVFLEAKPTEKIQGDDFVSFECSFDMLVPKNEKILFLLPLFSPRRKTNRLTFVRLL
jgi:hypothetical protein